MNKNYNIKNNGFSSEFTQVYLSDNRHLQVRHIDEEGKEHKFEIKAKEWSKRQNCLEATVNSHILRLVAQEGKTTLFIHEAEKKKKKQSKLW